MLKLKTCKNLHYIQHHRRGGKRKEKERGRERVKEGKGNIYSLSLSLLGWLEKIQRKGFIEVDPSVMKKFKIMCHIYFSHLPSFPFLLKIGEEAKWQAQKERDPSPALPLSHFPPTKYEKTFFLPLFSLPLPVPLSFLLTKHSVDVNNREQYLTKSYYVIEILQSGILIEDHGTLLREFQIRDYRLVCKSIYQNTT